MISDEYGDRCKEIIDEHGHMVQAVGGDPEHPSWVYTIGLSRWDHPELFTVGLPVKIGHSILNDVAEQVKAGQAVRPYTQQMEVVRDYPVYWLPVDDPTEGDWFNVGRTLQPHLRVVQMVFTDMHGKFPWEHNYSLDPRVQPLLGSLPG